MNPIAIAVKGKGSLGMLKRASIIGGRYGVTAGRMDKTLSHFAGIVGRFSCGATFPITISSLARHTSVIRKYQEQNIEFAMHGYHHVDHTQMTVDEQLRQIDKAHRVFKAGGIQITGFRSPYLRWNQDTLIALRRSGFLYEGSQGLAWDVVDQVDTDEYRHVLGFYGAVSARDYPALPHLEDELVRIPYCLPDDESLIDRFTLRDEEAMSELWLAVLARTYEQGELFTLGLHPERIWLCEAPLVAALQQARQYTPSVWMARLDEISYWWKSRMSAKVEIANGEKGEIRVRVEGPENITVLARGVSVTPFSTPWDGNFQRVPFKEFQLRSDRRPFIGVSPSSSPALKSFLRQQGYIFEETNNSQSHSFYIDRPDFDRLDERPLLAQIEHANFPMVRLGRWPNGARSALCVTGDIDALTIWDYGLRLLER